MRLLIVLVLLPSVLLACTGDDCHCWTPCFDPSRTAGQEKEYAILYNLIQGVRGAQIAYDIQGTAYVFDASANNTDLRIYQRNLASIFALTQPVDNECNPFLASQYLTNIAWAFFSWQCQDKCVAASTLQNFGYVDQTSPPLSGDWVGGGCFITNLLSSFPFSCTGNLGNKMVIAFQNSPVRSLLLSQCFAYDVGVAIKIDGDSMLPTLVPSGSNANLIELNTEVFGAQVGLAAASTDLLQCIRDCCGCTTTSGGRKKREVDDVHRRVAEKLYFVNGTRNFKLQEANPADFDKIIKENTKNIKEVDVATVKPRTKRPYDII